MSTNVRRRLSESERRKEIMDVTAEIIKEKGFFNTTMDEIVSKTTLSKGGVYHYYKNVLEIFKDLMIYGIEYRNNILKEHMNECYIKGEDSFIAEQLVEKIVDNNPYMPLYVEFLMVKKRKPELNELMDELQELTRQSFEKMIVNKPNWLIDIDKFQLLTDFTNAMIIASDVLEARERFVQNKQLLKNLVLLILKDGEEK